MARGIHRFKTKSLDAALKKPGIHSDGGGLFLRVRPSGSASWVFISVQGGQRRELGLGGYFSMPVQSARQKAQHAREAVANGHDLRGLFRPLVTIPTFGKVADDLIASMETSWRNEKHRAQWKTTLTGQYDESRVKIDISAHREHVAALKRLRELPVNKVDTADVMAVLKPIWVLAPETSSRLRGRLESVLSAAKAHGHRSGENPAAWRGHLDRLLPRPEKVSARSHQKALPYTDIPSFMGKLRSIESHSRLCLEFAILTAARSGEARGATWKEIDFDLRIWTIPAIRMKANKEHRVPLSDQALEILKRMKKLALGNLVFPGRSSKAPLTDAALSKIAKDLGGDISVHGFRSAFRDWAGDQTQFAREVAEAALAHRVGDETERAYRRSDALEKRRTLMSAWADYCKSRENKNQAVDSDQGS